MGNKKYADMKFYENKLHNVMQKLSIEKFYYKWTKSDAYIKFKYKNKWYLLEHTIKKANANRPNNDKIIYGSDLFAQLVLVLESLATINEHNIKKFSDWIVNLEIKYDNNLPESFRKLGFTTNLIPTQKIVNQKISELKLIFGPEGNFYSKENYEELLKIEKECNEYYIEKTKKESEE